MKKYLFLFLIGFNFISMNINAGENTIVSLENKMQKTEVEIETLQKQYEAEKIAIRNEYTGMLNEIVKEKNEIKLEKDEMKSKFNFLGWFAGLLGIGSIWSIRELFKSVRQRVKDEIELKVSTIVNIEKEKIEEIVKKYDVEEQLKKNKKICILSVNNENTSDIRKILNEFTGLTYKNITDSINFSTYDLILINHNENYEIEKINNIITQNEKRLFFYYGSGRADSSKKNVNFCNSIFTLYGNLIDLLRTQDLLNK